MKKIVALGMALTLTFTLCGCFQTTEQLTLGAEANTDAIIEAIKVDTLNKGTLAVGCEIGYPPFEYFDEDGKSAIGYDIDLGKEIARRLGAEYKVVDTAWDGIFAGLNADKYDCIISAVTITPERLKAFNFTDPYIKNYQCMLVKKGVKFDFTKPMDAKNIKIAVQSECSSDDYIKNMMQNGANFTRKGYDKVMECFTELELGRVDAIVCDTTVASSYLSKKDTPFEMYWTQESETGESPEQFGICIKKGNTKLTTAVNKALSDMKADGTTEMIYSQWFGTEKE